MVTQRTDKDLSDLLEVIEKIGLYENSIIIVMGEHGEQFYEHGHTSHHGLFEELIHIPLAVLIPAAKAKGRTVDSLVSQVDILPTILDCLEISTPEQCQGTSLKPLIDDKVDAVRDFVYAEYTGGAVPDSYAVRSARYKCIEQLGQQFAYDLTKDPGEQHKIFPAGFPKQVKTLQKCLQRLMPELPKENSH